MPVPMPIGPYPLDPNSKFGWEHWLTHSLKATPGLISTTADGWSVSTTKATFLGVTAHWIDVRDGKWKLCSEVVGFRSISGDHSGVNLARYFMGLCDRIGITNAQRLKVRHVTWDNCYLIIWWQLLTITLDNASSNTSKCETIEAIHERRKLPEWSASENRLP